MHRPLYIKELAVLAFPLGLVGRMLLPHEALLRNICFADNEVGDIAKATEVCSNRIVRPSNDTMRRNGKPLKLISVSIEHSRHHTVCVRFAARQSNVWVEDTVNVSLFLASKKAMAMERKANEEGEDYTIVAPRRGVVTKKPREKKRQQTSRRGRARRM